MISAGRQGRQGMQWKHRPPEATRIIFVLSIAPLPLQAEDDDDAAAAAARTTLRLKKVMTCAVSRGGS